MLNYTVFSLWQPFYDTKEEIFLKRKELKQIKNELRQKSKMTNKKERTVKGY